MKARTTLGTAAALGAAAVAVVFSPVVWGQQPAEKPRSETKIEQHVVTAPKTAGERQMVVTVEKQDGAEPKITMREVGGPTTMARTMASMAGGGPRLGVEIRDVAKADVAALKLTAQAGVVVITVTDGSAAAKAGVKVNDVVVQFDGENVRSAQQLTRLVRETAADRTVKLAVVREGKRVDLDVAPTAEPAQADTVRFYVNSDQIRGDVEKDIESLQGQIIDQYRLQRRAPEPGGPAMPGQGLMFRREMPGAGSAFGWSGEGTGPWNFMVAPGRGRLGVLTQELSPELAAYFGVKDGVLVSSVQADSPAAKAGIKAGDVITSANEKAVASVDELVKALGEKEGEVSIGLTRDKRAMTLKATIEAPKHKIVAVGRPA
jgi:serine protease Do